MKNKFVLAFCLIFVVVFMSFSLSSCDLLFALLGGEGEEGDGAFSPTSDQMVTALKQALTTGSSEAGEELSKEDAFYNTPRRIPLPSEAQSIISNLNGITGGSAVITAIGGNQAINDLVLRINRAAEKASNDVGRIFLKAIMDMTFEDAVAILKGSNTEATDYFRKKTTVPLTEAFSEVLDEALGTPIVSNISALSAWNGVVNPYNNFLAQPATQLAMVVLGVNWKPVETNLSKFVLEKALNAVFNEIAEMEKKIRDDPKKFITDLFSDISAKVFDWVKGLKS